MFRSTCAVLVIGVATAVAGPAERAADRAAGRVVRVERDAGPAGAAPRVCVLRGTTGVCVGEAPTVGDTAHLFDSQHVVASVQIVDVNPFSATCAQLWNVVVRARHGIPSEGESLAVIDPRLAPSRARVLHGDHLTNGAPGVGEDDVWRAIDRDGDDSLDILLTRYACDAAGRRAVGVSSLCSDVWTRTGGKLVRTTQLNFAQCNL